MKSYMNSYPFRCFVADFRWVKISDSRDPSDGIRMCSNLKIWHPKMIQHGHKKRWTWWINRNCSILYPIGSMYAIYDNIYHQYTPNVSIYTIHGSYGYSNPATQNNSYAQLNIWQWCKKTSSIPSFQDFSMLKKIGVAPMSHFSRKPAGPFAWNASPLWRFSCCVFFSSRCNRAAPPSPNGGFHAVGLATLWHIPDHSKWPLSPLVWGHLTLEIVTY